MFECCWTRFLQMLRGTEQRQLVLVSLQFYFITVSNSHSTSIRHHTLLIERINSLIKTRLATLCFASHPSPLQLLTSKTTPRQLDVQKPVPAASRSRATLRAGMLTLAGLPPRLLNTHFSQSASDQKCRQWKPIQPLRTSAVAVSRAGSLQVHERGIQKTLPLMGGRKRAPSCLWLPFTGMKRGRQAGQGFRTNEKQAFQDSLLNLETKAPRI